MQNSKLRIRALALSLGVLAAVSGQAVAVAHPLADAFEMCVRRAVAEKQHASGRDALDRVKEKCADESRRWMLECQILIMKKGITYEDSQFDCAAAAAMAINGVINQEK